LWIDTLYANRISDIKPECGQTFHNNNDYLLLAREFVLRRVVFDTKYLLLKGMIIVMFWQSYSLGSAREDFWIKKMNMPTPRYGLVAGVVNNRIYAIGGRAIADPLSTVEEYDPVTDKWIRKADMPTPRCFSGAEVVNNKIYVIGGFTVGKQIILPTVEEYDPVTNTWTRKADMPTPRYFVSCSAVNGMIYAIGGQTVDAQNNNVVLSNVEEYDPISDKWTSRSSMLSPKSTSTSVVDGKIYTIGGGSINKILSSVEEYDPVKDKWRGKEDMPGQRYSLSTSAVNGKIYAIGGGNNRILPVPTVEEYNSLIGKWTTRMNMPTSRLDFATGVVKDKIYAIGGTQEFPFIPFSTVEEYTPEGWPFSIALEDRLVTIWAAIKIRGY